MHIGFLALVLSSNIFIWFHPIAILSNIVLIQNKHAWNIVPLKSSVMPFFSSCIPRKVTSVMENYVDFVMDKAVELGVSSEGLFAQT